MMLRPPRRTHSSSFSLRNCSLCASEISLGHPRITLPTPAVGAVPSREGGKECGLRSGRNEFLGRLGGGDKGVHASALRQSCNTGKMQLYRSAGRGLRVARAAAPSRAMECIVSGTTSSSSSSESCSVPGGEPALVDAVLCCCREIVVSLSCWRHSFCMRRGSRSSSARISLMPGISTSGHEPDSKSLSAPVSFGEPSEVHDCWLPVCLPSSD
jgi:hypothetical protein